MKISISYKDVEKHRPTRKELAHFEAKLSRLLKTYDPDAVQLRGAFSQNPRSGEYTLSATLTLPMETLHATGTSPHIRACCKQAFGELEAQLKKHKQRLRKDYEWKRKRPRAFTEPAPST
jgi:ribosome-associated translation inhibitor RaiA